MCDLEAIVAASIFKLIQYYILPEDVPDLRFELGVERRATVVELVGLPKLNS